MGKNLITILGPTAVGKTRIAVYLASKFNGEIISADSRQIYKFMDIGTGKDLDEYIIENKKVGYYLIDIIHPDDEYDLYKFQNDFYDSYDVIESKKKLPFLVGGTGLYIHSVLKNYDLANAEFEGAKHYQLSLKPIDELRDILLRTNRKLHNTTDLLDKERVIKSILVAEANKSNNNLDSRGKFNVLVIGITMERSEIKNRITERLKNRLEEGMIDEVKSLLDMGISEEKLKFFGLEYKYISMYLNAEMNYNDMYQKLNSAIHNFAKRQMTWFRKMEKEGVEINWFHPSESGKMYNLIEKYLAHH